MTQADCNRIPTPSQLITNLAYKLKPHHTINQFLRSRLYICTDVNIMQTSVYKLVFQDPDLKKLAPSTLDIGTYTTNTVKIVGSCVPTHDYQIGQDMMFQDVTSKWWYPANITSLCSEPRSYNITTREGVNNRRTHAHLNPYQPQSKMLEAEHSFFQLIEQSSDMWTFKQSDCKKSDKKLIFLWNRTIFS